MSNEAQGQEKVAGTNLTTVPEYAQTALVLNDLKQRFAGRVFESLETDEQRKAAHKDIAEVRDYRTGLEAERKRIKAPALERCRLIDAEAARLTTELRALEDPMKAQLDAKEAEIEAEKIRKANAEAERVKGHMDAIQRMRDFPLSLQGKPAEVMDVRIHDFVVMNDCDWECFEEFGSQASDAYTAALASSRELLQHRRDHEAEQEQIKRDREELARQRAENERLQREADERREDDARREQKEREASERKERDRMDSLRAHIAAIKRVPSGIEFAKVEAIQEEIDALEILDPYASTFDFQELADEAKQAFDETMCTLRQAAFNAQRRSEEEALTILRRAEEEKRLAEQAEANRVEAQRLEAERINNMSLNAAVAAVVHYFRGLPDAPAVTLDLIKVWDIQNPPDNTAYTDKRTAAKPVRNPRTKA